MLRRLGGCGGFARSLLLLLRRRRRAAAALLVALGCCQILFSTGCNTTLQLETPDALLVADRREAQCVREAVERVISLYELWGKSHEADVWRKKL